MYVLSRTCMHIYIRVNFPEYMQFAGIIHLRIVQYFTLRNLFRYRCEIPVAFYHIPISIATCITLLLSANSMDVPFDKRIMERTNYKPLVAPTGDSMNSIGVSKEKIISAMRNYRSFLFHVLYVIICRRKIDSLWILCHQ